MVQDTPYQDLPQRPRKLAVDELLGVAELDVHVAVDALFSAQRHTKLSVISFRGMGKGRLGM